MYGKLVIFEAENVKVVRVICFETTIRKIYSFSCFIGIMLYENYFLILNVNDGKCCKLVGHKSFVSGIMFLNNGKMLMTSGMDRTVGMQCMENLLTKCWNKLEAVTK